MKKLTVLLLLTICLSAGFLPGNAAAQEEPWQFGLSIYGWFPTIAGETAFPDSGGSSLEVDSEDIIDNLEFVLMGTLNVRKGRWGMLTDFLYMDIGGSATGTRDATIGGIELPVNSAADINLDLKSWVWTLAGYYRAIEKPGYTLNILGGARHLDVEQTLNWNLTGNIGSIPLPGRAGNSKVELSNWDAIVGVTGRFTFGAKNTWFIPYYLDLGTGESDFTWQGLTGIGYAFSWGDITAAWRYLYYDMPSDDAIKDLSINGPVIGVTFRW
jgi:hypothetical protein